LEQWGTIMTLTGIVTSYQGLVVARFFLGLAEAGFFPAAAYLLTIWYKRYEIQSRMAVFYAACSLSGAFGGLLAFAIEKMDGIGGLAGWKWIFIIEGIFPALCAIPVWFYLPDTPETADFLTPEEKEFIIVRLKEESGSNTDKITWQLTKDALLDWKIWAMMVIYQGVSVGVYGFTSIVPTVVEAMGYRSAEAQLMTVPIYVAAVICVLIIAFWSDHAQTRTPFIIGAYSIAVVGFVAQLALPQTRLFGVTYFFLFLIAIGLYGPFVSIMCLCVNNLAPSSKRAVGVALLVTVGNFGGFIGSNIFLQSQAPKYPTGFGTCLGILCASIGMTFVVRRALKKENERRDKWMEGKTVEEVKSQYTEEQLTALGDKSPLFRYTL
jgi:MFS family permease